MSANAIMYIVLAAVSFVIFAPVDAWANRI